MSIIFIILRNKSPTKPRNFVIFAKRKHSHNMQEDKTSLSLYTDEEVQQGIQEVFQGWKDSPSHCKNMMSQEFREMGFAKVGDYWVQDLGKSF